jgi:DNA invertase Pin-like site-specific DNA recombinase
MATKTPYSRNAVGYVRTAYADADSAARQRRVVSQFCASIKIELVACEVDEGASGRNLRRPGIERLLASWVKNPDIFYIVVLDRARLARSIGLVADCEAIFKAHGKRLLYVNDGGAQLGTY